MALAIRKLSPYKSRMLSTLVLAFALVLQPMYGLVAIEAANAAPLVATTHNGFNSLTGWVDDRATPSGGYTLSDSQLTLRVDGDNPDPKAAGNAFYRTEGRQATLPAGTNSISATLHVDSAWENVIGVRAGIWGVTGDPLYPILEFSNRNDANDQSSGSPVIRAWDSNTGWENLVENPTYGSDYTFEIVHDPIAQNLKYYLNGNDTPVYTAQATANSLTNIIFNNYNSGIAGHDYSVVWSNFKAGVKLPTPEVTSVDAYYITKPDYTAISVDFKTKNITNATGVELRVNRTGGGTYSMTAKQSVIDAINGTNPSVTTGPIVLSGKRTSSSWNNQAGTWTGTAAPVSVEVIITRSSGGPVTGIDELISTNKASQTAAIPSDVTGVMLNGKSVNVARGYNCGPTDFNGVHGKISLSANITDVSGVSNVKYNVRKVSESGCTQTGIYKSGTVSMSNSGANSWVTLPAAELDTMSMDGNGTYTILMQVTDNDGNVTTKYVDILVDNSNPVITNATISKSLVNNTSTPTLTADVDGTDSSVATAQYRIHTKSGAQVSGQSWVDMNAQDGAFDEETESIVKVMNLSGLVDGEYVARIRAFDAAGNKKSGIDVDFTVDNTAPNAEILSATLASENLLAFTGTVSDKNFEHYYCWLTRTTGGEISGTRDENCLTTWASDLQRNGNPATSLTTGTDGETQLGSFNIAGLEDGDYIIRMGAVDRAGNRYADATYAFTVDRSLFNQPEVEEEETEIPGGNTGGNDGTGGESVSTDDDDDNDNVFTQQLFTTPFGFAFQPFTSDDDADQNENEATNNDNSDVAGVQDEEESTTRVLGDEDVVAQTDEGEIQGSLLDDTEVEEGCASFLGLCWYWPVAGAVGLVVVAYIVRLLRGGRGEDQPA